MRVLNTVSECTLGSQIIVRGDEGVAGAGTRITWESGTGTGRDQRWEGQNPASTGEEAAIGSCRSHPPVASTSRSNSSRRVNHGKSVLVTRDGRVKEVVVGYWACHGIASPFVVVATTGDVSSAHDCGCRCALWSLAVVRAHPMSTPPEFPVLPPSAAELQVKLEATVR